VACAGWRRGCSSSGKPRRLSRCGATNSRTGVAGDGAKHWKRWPITPTLRTLLPQVSLRHQRNCLRGWVRAEGGAGLALLREALEMRGRTVNALLASATVLWAAELDAPRLLAFCHDGPSPVAQAGLLAQLTKLPV